MSGEHPADHSGPLVFVADLDGPELADGDRHHLERVLRLRVGESLTIADGTGRWRTARLGPAVEVTGPIVEQTAGTPRLSIGFALVKGDKPELIVQKLTELGIDRIVPFRAERSVVRWDAAKAGKAVTRLRLVARAAAMQCHRPDLPVVEDVQSLVQLVAEDGVGVATRDGQAPTLASPTLLVGPEGGWSDDELELGLPRVRLASHVLRAETAAVAAGVVLAALRADVVGPAAPPG